MLHRSVGIREQMAGPVNPDVANALEGDARLLRHWNLEAAAADMDARAKEIRIKLETPAPTPAESF
jgi:hypothetical protein